MTDHETFLLLAAKEIHEGLTADESRALDGHLAECPSCRRFATGMQRDEMRLRAVLTEAPVAVRVRRTVLDSAAGRRRTDARLALALAAALVIGIVALPVLVGGGNPAPTAAPSASAGPGDTGTDVERGTGRIAVSGPLDDARRVGIGIVAGVGRRGLRLQRRTRGHAPRLGLGPLRGRRASRGMVADDPGDRWRELIRRARDLPRHRWTGCVAGGASHDRIGRQHRPRRVPVRPRRRTRRRQRLGGPVDERPGTDAGDDGGLVHEQVHPGRPLPARRRRRHGPGRQPIEAVATRAGARM